MKLGSAGVPSSEKGDIMTYYRLYYLDGANGQISDFNEFEVAGDAAAIAAADRLRRMAAMELWCGGRKVRHWEPVGAAPAYRLPTHMANFPAPSRMSPSGVRSSGRQM
jgi:hypothetical protein